MPSHIFAKTKMRGRLTSRPCPCCDDLRNTKQIYINSKEFAKKEIDAEIGYSDMINDITESCEYLYKEVFPKDVINVYFHYIYQEYIVSVNNNTKWYRLDDIDAALRYARFENLKYSSVDELLLQYHKFEMADFENKDSAIEYGFEIGITKHVH